MCMVCIVESVICGVYSVDPRLVRVDTCCVKIHINYRLCFVWNAVCKWLVHTVAGKFVEFFCFPNVSLPFYIMWSESDSTYFVLLKLH